ncbi:MAG TPA: hypothetical protein VGJ30_14115, partial [Candidatus Angelobacter sp.]
ARLLFPSVFILLIHYSWFPDLDLWRIKGVIYVVMVFQRIVSSDRSSGSKSFLPDQTPFRRVSEIASQHHEFIFKQNVYLCHPDQVRATQE